MGKPYFCEFCEKSFADNPSSRKNHLKGVVHRQLKKQHYDSFKDAATILKEEYGKNPCRKFFNEGHCGYVNCIYSHLSAETKVKLEQQAREDEMKARQKKLEIPKYDPKLEDWLAKFKEKQNKERGSCSKQNDSSHEISEEMYEIPECLQNKVNLPPSLLPSKVGEFSVRKTDEWG